MSIVKIISVFCDVSSDRCHGWIAQERTTTEARAVARRNGWRRESGQDVCPGCHSDAPMPHRVSL